MGSGDDKNVLKHLLNLETEAAALVNDAQAEADRRLGESDKQGRLLYDREYSAEAGRLQAAYEKEITQAKADYKKSIEAYRDELKAQHLNTAAFNALAGKFLERK
ncbi:MAG: hypothetical protein FWD78_15760 [Treponema sp.]|nr:hypothetical protein [Treponema sp.]